MAAKERLAPYLSPAFRFATLSPSMADLPLTAERLIRRRVILDAAVAIFAAQGFQKSRTRDIAAAAGVAEGTIYLYFEGKDDLLMTAFREKVAEFCEAARRILRESPPFEERLRRFVELHFTGIEAEPELAMVLLLEARQSAKFYGEPVRQVLRQYAAAVDELLSSGVAEGSVRPEISIPLARRMLIGGLEEIELDWLLGQRTRSLAPLAIEVSRAFHEGIGSRRGD
jgi:TetR/AcrR family transcriptional regulator, fatty acid metabolism regulator protein